MSHINYETDILKHFVRTNGWLTASHQQKQSIKKRSKKIPLRYFTFCAAEAVDIFMLERAGILNRSDKSGRLEGVYFCEEREKEFGIIADLIGSYDQGFQGAFEKIVLFEDDEDTLNKNIYDDELYPQNVRKKLRTKDAHHRLRDAFPFDIINLDVCGVMFPLRKGVITPLVKSILRILEWQTSSRFPINEQSCNQFTLFLTSHIDPDITDKNAIEQLENRLTENLDANSDFLDVFIKKYGHNKAKKLKEDNFAEFFCLALPKFIIHKVLYHFGWTVAFEPSYLYNRDDLYAQDKQYQMMHSVSVYERIPDFNQRLDNPSFREYTRAVTRVVNEGTNWIEDLIDHEEVRDMLLKDLSEIIEFRDQYR